MTRAYETSRTRKTPETERGSVVVGLGLGGWEVRANGRGFPLEGMRISETES